MFEADAIEDVFEGVAVAGPIGELDAVISQHGMDGVRHSGDQFAQKLGCRHLARLLM